MRLHGLQTWQEEFTRIIDYNAEQVLPFLQFVLPSDGLLAQYDRIIKTKCEFDMGFGVKDTGQKEENFLTSRSCCLVLCIAASVMENDHSSLAEIFSRGLVL